MTSAVGDHLGSLAIWANERNRIISEARIVDLLICQGWLFDWRIGALEFARSKAQAALNELVDCGLPFARRSDGQRLFDPVETINSMIQFDRCGRSRIWSDYCVPNGRRLSLSFAAFGSASGPAPDFKAFASQHMRFSFRRFFAPIENDSSRVLRLRLPRPLANAALDVENLVAVTANATGEKIRITEDRIEVEWPAHAKLERSLGFDADVIASPIVPVAAAPPLADNLRDLYTSRSEGLIQVTAKVAAFAGRVAAPLSDPWPIALRLYDFFVEEMNFGMVHYDQLLGSSAMDWALEWRWCDCLIGSALFVALLRAKNIPSRLISGFLSYPAAPAPHSWFEFWVDGLGWTPVDLQGWHLSRAGVDAKWGSLFFGKLDPRVACERPPRQFTGLSSIRLPARWCMLTAPAVDGLAFEFIDRDTGQMVWRDAISVDIIDDCAGPAPHDRPMH